MGDVDTETQYGAYADYYTVIPMIQKQFYDVLDLYEKCQFFRVSSIDNSQTRKTRHLLQAKLITLKHLLVRYNSVKHSNLTGKYLEANYPLDKIYDLMTGFENSCKPLKWEAIVTCIEALGDSHFALGLSDIEVDKRKDKFMDPKQRWIRVTGEED